MASRTRLGLVTALTVASMLLGGGAMNALAKEHGHGNKHGKVEHAQATAAVSDVVDAPDRVTGETRPGLGCGDDNHVHTGPPGNPDKECKAKHTDNHEEDDDDDGED
jgi:hypothetical protein